MPATFSARTGYTTVTCTQCGRGEDVHEHARHFTGAEVTTVGTNLGDFIRFLPARSRYHAWCRSCERAARTANPSLPRNRPATGVAAGEAFTSRKFGVELEAIYPPGTGRNQIDQALQAAGLSELGWRCRSDGSLRGNGWEVVSPPLTGEAGLDQLQVACRALIIIGAVINRSCGTHVHHDATDLTVDHIKSAARSWFNNQGLIDGLVSGSRRGANASTYCKAITPDEMARINRARSLEDIRRISIGRYKTLNLQAYSKFGTLEIRQHQGTLSFEKIASWIRFGQAIIDTAKAETVNTHTTMRGFLGTLGDRLDATAKTYLLGRTVEFAHATL